MKLPDRRDLTLAAAILLIAVALFGLNYISHKKPVVTTQTAVDGKVVKILDLSRDTELAATGANKETNHLIVRDSEIWCSEVNCPDKICAHQDKKHLGSDTTVCLPNKMIVTITGDE